MDAPFALFMQSFPEHRLLVIRRDLSGTCLCRRACNCLLQAAHLQAETIVRDTLWHLKGCLYVPQPSSGPDMVTAEAHNCFNRFSSCSLPMVSMPSFAISLDKIGIKQPINPIRAGKSQILQFLKTEG